MRCTDILAVKFFICLTVSNFAIAEKPAPQYESKSITVPGAYAEEPKIELSTGKAAQYLDQGAQAWGEQRKCVSCHTNGTYLFIRPALTPTLGKPTEQAREFFIQQLHELNKQGARKLRTSGTRPAQVIYIAAGLAQWDQHVTKRLSSETQLALKLMFDMHKGGSWYSLNCWPPFESSQYQEAHMAAMAVASAPGWLAALSPNDPLLEAVGELKNYLRESPPPHDYARVLQLWTSLRLDGILDDSGKQDVVRLLRGRQQKDGGWSLRQFAAPEEWGGGNRAEKLRSEKDFKAPQSDGHMTGLAMLVLQEAGVADDSDSIQRGLDWIRANQRESGRWWTRSLNTDKWHFITYSGTAYSLLALQQAAAARSAD